jgi:excisionase family DNA binding protein
VLTLREAALRLGITTDEVEAMLRRGAVPSLMAGWTVVVPTREVEKW